MGGYKSGDVTVMEPDVCNIPQAMKDVTKVCLIPAERLRLPQFPFVFAVAECE